MPKTWKMDRDVDTDQIIPARFLVTGDPVELGRHCFEDSRPEFAAEVERGDIIVAGPNFGCGSSREHAPRAIVGCGVSAVVASSFSRIFFRNAVNIGLPLLECPEAVDDAKDGDEFRVFVEKGLIENSTQKTRYQARPVPELALAIARAGGLMSWVMQETKT